MHEVQLSYTAEEKNVNMKMVNVWLVASLSDLDLVCNKPLDV